MNSRYAVRLLLITGAITVVLAATPYHSFDLDRFFAPKELALHAFTLALALLCLPRAAALELTVTDLLLAFYLLLSAVSALFAGDHWLAMRALAVTLSGAGVFWVSRSAAEGGARRAIVAAAAAAAVLGAAASLAQAYGYTSAFFSINRIPGGTLGNRNFMAHLAVICVPALVLAAVTARRAWGALAAAAGAAVIAAALVLSRSRAAYLGLGAGLAVLAYGLWRARGRWGAQPYSPRLKALALAAVLGALAALLLPNTLAWRSGSPYLDTVTGMVNYRKGSGHGRIVQYTRTLRLAAQHPVLGVGTGNWAVVYPKLAAHYDHDPSMNYFRGTTLNPWPSSDWVAVASERGLPALAVLLLVFLGLLLGAWRKTARAADRDEYFEGVALAAALAATATVACFDAVLLLPAPAFIAWALFGALAAAAPHKFTLNLTPRLRGRLLAAVALVGAAAVLRSAGQVAAMGVFSKARTLAQFGAAARLDPGNARIRERYAALLERRNQAPAAAPEPELLPAATTEMELPVQTDDDEVSTSTAAPETD